MKTSTLLFSVLLAFQALPGVVHSAAAQAIDGARAQADDYVDSRELQRNYRMAVHKRQAAAPAYAYDEVIDRVETLPDGNQVKSRRTTGYLRDHDGRMQITSTVRGVQHIVVVDPTTEMAYMVRPERKDVLRLTAAQLAQEPAGTAPFVLPEYYKTATHTALGTKEVAGVVATGTAGEVTIPAGTRGNERDVVETHESWYAKALGEMVYSHSTSPLTGDYTRHVENLKLGDVQAVTFTVPEGYAVRDVVVANALAQQ